MGTKKQPANIDELPDLLAAWAERYGVTFELQGDRESGDYRWVATCKNWTGATYTTRGRTGDTKIKVAQDACLDADDRTGFILGRPSVSIQNWNPPQHGKVSEWLEGE